MYWKLRTIPVACALLLSWYALTARADQAEDQYTVAAHHYSAARWQLAIEEFTALLASYPDHPHVGPATFFLAESLMQVGDWEAARTRFTQYLELGAEGQFVRQASFRLGEASYLAGDHARARDELRRFREQYPADELCAYALPYLGELALTREDEYFPPPRNLRDLLGGIETLATFTLGGPVGSGPPVDEREVHAADALAGL